ncbi:MAG TPA: pyridoxal-dependent decarboxylase [Actinomycetota bacterium]|nr:pyridoxal-dependent decarboxylase [Actinomycetota bacterium]
MDDSDRPLRLDAPREEALEHAAKLVAEAWRSFDRPRPEEPPLDEGLRALLQAGLPQEPVSVHEALEDAARALDESIAQPRPRYFAFIGSSGLEIGALGDLLASTYDMNLAVDARAATMIEQQAVGWVGEFVGYPATNGAFTSGGTISNMTALAAGSAPPCTPRPRSTTRSPAPWSCSGSGATGSATSRSTASTGCARSCWPSRSTGTWPMA